MLPSLTRIFNCYQYNAYVNEAPFGVKYRLLLSCPNFLQVNLNKFVGTGRKIICIHCYLFFVMIFVFDKKKSFYQNKSLNTFI